MHFPRLAVAAMMFAPQTQIIFPAGAVPCVQQGAQIVCTVTQISGGNTAVNGGYEADRAAGGIDVAPAAYPVLGGVSYSVWNAKPAVVFPDHSRAQIPTSASDLLGMIKGLPGCSVAGKPFYPAEGICR